MSGLRPVDDRRLRQRQRLAHRRSPEDLPLTTTFRKAGYYVCGAGKIYHGGYRPRRRVGRLPRGRRAATRKPTGRRPASAASSSPRSTARTRTCATGRSSDYGIDQLGKKHDKPFFLACRPAQAAHALERAAEVLRHVPARQDRAAAAPRGRPRRRPARRRADGQARRRPRGDRSSPAAGRRPCRATSPPSPTATRMIGRLIDALDKSRRTRTTRSSCFWGDHGWHLGEKQHWRKFALWEEATRAPLIWVAPGVTKPDGVCDRTVDFMSIYPTLTDLVRHPDARRTSRARASARCWPTRRPRGTRRRSRPTGSSNHAVRTEGWRYIRYANGDEELYDETTDPYEWTNLAGGPEVRRQEGRAGEVPPDEGPSRHRRRGGRTGRQDEEGLPGPRGGSRA